MSRIYLKGKEESSLKEAAEGSLKDLTSKGKGKKKGR